jgi:hypothetical protein
MTTTADRLARLEAMVSEIHVAVIGDGSAGSSLRERVQALETSHQRETGWRYRTVNSAAVAVVASALSWLAHALTLAATH